MHKLRRISMTRCTLKCERVNLQLIQESNDEPQLKIVPSIQQRRYQSSHIIHQNSRNTYLENASFNPSNTFKSQDKYCVTIQRAI